MCDSSGCCDYVFPYNYNSNNNYLVSSTSVFPSLTDFAGDLNFQIILNANDECIKKKWLFSEKLKKVFIDMDKIIGLRFKWDYTELPEPKFIRALPVYTQDDSLRIPVERCPMHSSYTCASNSDPRTIYHVLRCENEGTEYDTNIESRRRSCVTPVMLKNDKDIATLFYKFVCKTSCDRGMHRRPIVVIFTLENNLGVVLGRRCLAFKICSCLKRDLRKEEQGKEKSKIRKTINLSSNGIHFPNSRTSLLPNVTTMRNVETVKPVSLEIRLLNSEQLLHIATIIHNTLLGEWIRNNLDGTDILIPQVERAIAEIHLRSLH